MTVQCSIQGAYEISPRFRSMLDGRIARLDQNALEDEAQVERLADFDHIRRQLRLVAAERAEALRMRLFLDHSTTRILKADSQLS